VSVSFEPKEKKRTCIVEGRQVSEPWFRQGSLRRESSTEGRVPGIKRIEVDLLVTSVAVSLVGEVTLGQRASR
jgi:hypothetical protein